MPKPAESVPIVPVADFCKVHLITPAQFLHFYFRKAGVFLKVKLVCHGVFPEHVQRRMLPVFLYRQDSRHIRQRDIRLIL